MKLTRGVVSVLTCFFLLGNILGQTGSSVTRYHLLKRIVIGGEGSWDYPTLDLTNHLLYISHETRVEIVNIDSGELVRGIPNLQGVHGIAAVPEMGKVFVTEGKADSVSIFDTKASAIGKIKTGKGPDAIIYDPATRRLFTSNGDSADMTAINASTGDVLGTIPVGGDPESITVNGKGLLWVVLADKNEVLTVDTRKLVVKTRWAIAGCKVAKSVAVDDSHHRLFVGCRNQVMAVVNSKNGRVIKTLPIGDHVDATIFDPDTKMIFNSNGDGTITVIHEDSPNRFSVVDTINTLPGAKTMAFDPKSKKLFLPVRETNTVNDGASRQKTVAGAFIVLVFGQ